MKTPAHTGRIGSRLICRDRNDAATLLRWLSHYAPGLRTELEDEGNRFPTVRLGCEQAAANELWYQFERGGRRRQEERDAAAGEGGWEE